MRTESRRYFIWTILGAGGLSAAVPSRKPETVYRFSTPEFDGTMSVQFQDRYASRGFWFKDRESTRRFCLSGTGDEGRGCLPDFSGSLAIAIYHFYPRAGAQEFMKVREHVRTIDQDSHLAPRPPFDGSLTLRQRTASDIQAFGSRGGDAARNLLLQRSPDPWCYLRQDLFLDDRTSPFLIVHWKHTLNAITLIDVLPGERTQLSRG